MKPADPIGSLLQLNRTSHNRSLANAILALAIAIVWLGSRRDFRFRAVRATFARRASTFDAGSWERLATQTTERTGQQVDD